MPYQQAAAASIFCYRYEPWPPKAPDSTPTPTTSHSNPLYESQTLLVMIIGYNVILMNTAFQPNKSIDDLLVNLAQDGQFALNNHSATNIVTYS